MEKKKRFKMPHAYVIIFMMTVITAILANIIPAGTFDRVEDASGNSVVVADSFHHVDKIGCSIFDMFKSFQIGFEDSAQIIFFIIFAYAFVYVDLLLSDDSIHNMVKASIIMAGIVAVAVDEIVDFKRSGQSIAGVITGFVTGAAMFLTFIVALTTIV